MVSLKAWSEMYRERVPDFQGAVAHVFSLLVKEIAEASAVIASDEAIQVEVRASGVTARIDTEAPVNRFFSDKGRRGTEGVLYSVGSALYCALYGMPFEEAVPAWRLCRGTDLFGLHEVIIDLQDPLSVNRITCFDDLKFRLEQCMNRIEVSLGDYCTPGEEGGDSLFNLNLPRTTIARSRRKEVVNIGVDFGSSNSFVCFHDGDGEIQYVPLDGEHTELKSVLYFKTPSQVLTGREALERAVGCPTAVYRDFKRGIGDNSCRVQIRCENGEDIWMNSDDASLLLLREIGKRVRAYFSAVRLNAVVTTPAQFASTGKNGIVARIAREAGFDTVVTRVEPYAAAVAYGRYHNLSDRPQNVLVFDFGGGTLDLAAISFSPAGNEILSMGGDEKLGGTDITAEIIKRIYRGLREDFGLNMDSIEDSGLGLVEYKANEEAVWKAAESIKYQLSELKHDQSALVHMMICVPSYGSGRNEQKCVFSLSKVEFYELLEPIFGRIRRVLDEFFLNDRVSPQNVDLVAFAGGSCNVPEIRDCVAEYFRYNMCRPDIPKDEYLRSELSLMISRGAALLSADKDERLSAINEKGAHTGNVVLRTSDDYGILAETNGVPGGVFKVIIAKNTELPCSGSDYFFVRSGCSSLNIRAFSRNWKNPDSKRINFDEGFASLGLITVRFKQGLGPGMAVKVRFTVDMDMNMEVRAEVIDSASGRRVSEADTAIQLGE